MNLPKIIIFQEDERARNYRWKLPEKSTFRRQPIMVRSFEYDKDEFLKNNEVIVDNKNFDLDTVFYLHPNRDNVYIEQSKFEDHIFKERILRYIAMAQKLGAKKATLTAELLETKSLDIDANGSVRYKVFKMESNYKKEVEEKFKKTYLDSTEYQPSENFDLVKNFKEAQQWIKDENLYFDLDLIHFVNSRNPETDNLLSKKTLITKLTQDTNELLSISANLAVGPLFSLKAGFKENVSSLKELLLKIELEF